VAGSDKYGRGALFGIMFDRLSSLWIVSARA